MAGHTWIYAATSFFSHHPRLILLRRKEWLLVFQIYTFEHTINYCDGWKLIWSMIAAQCSRGIEISLSFQMRRLVLKKKGIDVHSEENVVKGHRPKIHIQFSDLLAGSVDNYARNLISLNNEKRSHRENQILCVCQIFFSKILQTLCMWLISRAT